ncbi:MAG: helix-turn-helix domain-containing protein [Deltaproteobacteria bacterium]
MSNYREDNLARFAEAFKALSNPNRLAIFLPLVSGSPPDTLCSFDEEMRKWVGALGKGLHVVSSTISHHIKELRRSGLIDVQKRGKFTQCWVDGEAVRLLSDLLTGGLAIEDPSEESLFKAAREK